MRRPRGTSREAVRSLILKGIPDGGMPAFKMPDDQADAITDYVMTLKQPAGAATPGTAVSGDAAV